MTKIDQIVTDGRAKHGDRFDPSDLAPQFAKFYGTDARVRVESPGGFVRTGRIGKTTGWRPAFLLMHRRGDMGSSDVLRATDKITHVQIGRIYKPITDHGATWSVKA
jgi:hypothetical protein